MVQCNQINFNEAALFFLCLCTLMLQLYERVMELSYPWIKGLIAVKTKGCSLLSKDTAVLSSASKPLSVECAAYREVHSKLQYVSRCPFLSDNCMLRFQSAYLKL